MLPKLKHVRYVRTRGKVYAYFNTGRKTRDGRPEYAAMPNPASASFFQSYAALKGARDARAKPTYIFATLVKDYQASAEFAEKSEGTRKTYNSILKQAVDLLGEFPLEKVDRTALQMILDRSQWGAGKRNLFVAVIGVLFRWARARGKTDASPTKDIKTADTGEHAAWPQDVIDRALEDEGRAGLAVALMLYTGQRIGDVCAMRWDAIKGNAITVTQQKTGKRLIVPFHADLRARLERTPRTAMTLLVGEHGRPSHTATIRREVKTLAGREGLNPHGLRKNAVMALLRSRCTVAEVASITGQSFKLVEYYARQIDQERMAEAAILRWEQTAPMQTRLQQNEQGAENK